MSAGGSAYATWKIEYRLLLQNLCKLQVRSNTCSDLVTSTAAGTKWGTTRLADPHRERRAWDHPAASEAAGHSVIAYYATASMLPALRCFVQGRRCTASPSALNNLRCPAQLQCSTGDVSTRHSGRSCSRAGVKCAVSAALAASQRSGGPPCGAAASRPASSCRAWPDAAGNDLALNFNKLAVSHV